MWRYIVVCSLRLLVPFVMNYKNIELPNAEISGYFPQPTFVIVYVIHENIFIFIAILIVIITRDSEVIMFSPCVFVCLFVCLCVCVVVYVCHDVCPDGWTTKDWCHTNNILQVHCWGCLVVQVMFRALMTSLMTSQDHKVGQILKLIYLLQYLSYSVDQKLKMSDMLMAIFLVYSTSGITSGKKVCRELKMAAILKILKS